MQGRFRRGLAQVALVGMLTACGFAAGVTARGTEGAAAPPAAGAAQPPAPEPEAVTPLARGGLPQSFATLVKRAAPAVVHVKTVSVVKTGGFGLPPGMFGDDGPFGGFGERFGFRVPRGGGGQGAEMRQRGSGSGVIIRADGIVLTNNHVVENAKEITVTQHDGTEHPAKVLGRDPKTDLAVLAIEHAGTYPTATLGSSGDVEVGDWVVAIGNPFGLESSVTAGIVSAKGRAIGQGPYDDFIQTDAPINPGNSGGPLLNDRGEVIGINSAIFSQSGGSIGIGFAVPIDVAKQLVPELEEHGHVTRAWLGVTIQAVTPDLAESLGVKDAKGALVAQVMQDSPARQAGIAPGDVITRFDGKTVEGNATLPKLVAGTKVGATVPVTVLRDGAEKTLEVTVTAQQDDTAAADDGKPKKGRFGLSLRELTPEERAQRDVRPGEGVLVAGVAPGSPADEAGIHAGDVVLQANRRPVGSASALQAEAAKVAEGKPLLLLVRPADGTDRFAALASR